MLIWALGSLKCEVSFLFIGQKSTTFHHSCADQWFMWDMLKTGYPQACWALQESLASLFLILRSSAACDVHA